MSNWQNLMKLTWSLCQLKASPQDLPYSLSLMFGALLIHIVLSCSLLLFSVNFGEAFAETVLLTSISIVFTYAVLYWRKSIVRYPQTFTALLLTSILLNLLVLPLIVLQPILLQGPLKFVIGFFFFSYIVLLNIWMIVVMMYIYKEALEIEWFPAAWVTFGYLMINFLLLSMIVDA